MGGGIVRRDAAIKDWWWVFIVVGELHQPSPFIRVSKFQNDAFSRLDCHRVFLRLW